MSEQVDKKLQVAVYGIVRNELDSLAQGLVVHRMQTAGYVVTEYVDEVKPRQGEASEWANFLSDIAKGLYYGVALWQPADGILEYCSRYNTLYVLLDNILDAHRGVSLGRKTRLI
jgi:hypothetical protein